MLLLPPGPVRIGHHRDLPVRNLQICQRMLVSIRYAALRRLQCQSFVRSRFKPIHKMHKMPTYQFCQPRKSHAKISSKIALLPRISWRTFEQTSGEPLRWYFARILEGVWAGRIGFGWWKRWSGDAYGEHGFVIFVVVIGWLVIDCWDMIRV